MYKRAIVSMVLIFLVISCNSKKIRTIDAPKETLPFIQLVKPGSSLVWILPEKWVEKPLESFRKASYDIPTLSGSFADFSIVSFPGDVGGTLSNVNRWRNQLGLGPVTEFELDKIKISIQHELFDISFYDLRSTNESILVAMFPFNKELYFFKVFLSDLSSIENIKTDFLEVLNELEIK